MNVPMTGYAAVTTDAAIDAVQVWCGFPAIASTSSATGVNPSDVAAVHPPDDAENIV